MDDRSGPRATWRGICTGPVAGTRGVHRRARAAARPPCAAISARPRSAHQCDLCLNPPEATDVTVAAQKALSPVHRLGCRFGRGRIVDHLLGKTKDARASETQLSTFSPDAEENIPR